MLGEFDLGFIMQRAIWIRNLIILLEKKNYSILAS